MTRSSYFFIKVIGVCSLVSKVCGAQEIRLPSSVTCATCTIVAESVTTLVGANFDGPDTNIGRAPSGIFYLLEWTDRVVKAYDNRGALLRQVGRQGAGPGEYEAVRNILLGRDGSIHLIDAVLGRRSVYSADGVYVRSLPMRNGGGLGGLHAVLLPNDDLIINTERMSGAAAAPIVQRLDAKGLPTHSIMDTTGNWRQGWLHQRKLWMSATGDLIVANPYTFEIELYDSNLRKLRSLTRLEKWIPEQAIQTAPGDGVFDQPYAPRIRAVWVDAQSRLWIYSMVPSSLWKPVRRPVSGATQPNQDSLAARPRVSSIIEVVDLNRNRVVTRLRVEGSLGLPFGGGYFAEPVVNANGEPSLKVKRVLLKP
jgi:hypothetical protein